MITAPPLLPAITIDELKFFGGLAVVTAIVIGFLVFFGRKLSNAAEQNSEYIDLPLYVTRTGTIVFACVVPFWVYYMVVRTLSPHCSLGEFLGTFGGGAAVILGSITFVAIAWPVFDRLGYPLAKWHKDSDSV